MFRYPQSIRSEATVAIVQRKQEQRFAQRRREETENRDIQNAQHFADIVDKILIGNDERDLCGAAYCRRPSGDIVCLPVIHDEPCGRAMQHHAARFAQVQLIRRSVLNGVDRFVRNLAVRRIHRRFHAENVHIFAGNAHIDFANLRIRFHFSGGNGIAHALHHLARRVPVPVRIAIIGNRSGADDIQPVPDRCLRAIIVTIFEVPNSMAANLHFHDLIDHLSSKYTHKALLYAYILVLYMDFRVDANMKR